MTKEEFAHDEQILPFPQFFSAVLNYYTLIFRDLPDFSRVILILKVVCIRFVMFGLV